MKGFTLIELLIVIAVTVILAMAAVPIYGNLQVSAQLNENTSQIIQALRTARERSVAGLNNKEHGVYFDINAGDDIYTLYQGASYADRDTDYDKAVTLDSTLTLSSSDFSVIGSDVDVNFSKGLGVPGNTGTLTLTHDVTGSRSIDVNEVGMVEEN